jgi:magnesium transporter
MNFQYMPELQSRWGYPVVLGIMIVCDVYLAYRFKKASWF